MGICTFKIGFHEQQTFPLSIIYEMTGKEVIVFVVHDQRLNTDTTLNRF